MLEYSVGSSIESDNFNAELLYNGNVWGELCLSEDKKNLDFIIYPSNISNILVFNYDELMALIERAKKHLLQLEPLKD
ncbi:hypothetical protein [Orbus mooreae]|uniref:hypothetical protein n=1 Tax=Orbus mooreae TaxID=3074107 RepID=UPI00370D8866